MLAAAYDPSRDLSPNLPCQESSDSSGCSTSSSSGGSTCCKSEYTPCRECSGSPQTATAAAAIAAIAVGGGHHAGTAGTGGSNSVVVGGLGSSSGGGGGGAAGGGGGGLLCGSGNNSDTKSKCSLGGGSNLPPPGCGGGGAGGNTATGLHEDVICAGCNGRITDRFYLFAVDRKWHASCLQCSQCRVPLDGEVTCFARDGSIFCKKDYYRLANFLFIYLFFSVYVSSNAYKSTSIFNIIVLIVLMRAQ